MSTVKSILKQNPEIAVSPTNPVPESLLLNNKRYSNSWFGRLQSKLYTQLNGQQEDWNDVFMIEKQNLKRVTFSIENFVTEHIFSIDDAPLNETFTPQSSPTVTDLYTYYENACLKREQGCIDYFRSILRANRNSQLRSINLSKQTINENEAIPVSDVLKLDFGLTNLSLSKCNLTDQALKILLCSLLVSDTVRHLNLSNNNFTAKGYKYIALYLKSSKNIQSIDISQCAIEKKGMAYLSQGLRYATSVSKLTMNYCTLDPVIETLNIFSEGIAKSNSLKTLLFCYNCPFIVSQDSWLINIVQGPLSELNLTGNNIGSKLDGFSDVLKQNTSLEQLILSDCNITSQGLLILSNALLENGHLKSLDLSKNPLGLDSDEAVSSLKTVLSSNSSLTCLNLSETKFDSGAVITLAEALPENNSLTRLDLSKNPMIDTAGILALSVAIKMNDSLTFLDINIPPTDEELANLQNDIIEACTANMLKKVEIQQKINEQEPESVSSCASSVSNATLDIDTKEILTLTTKQILDGSESPKPDTILHESPDHNTIAPIVTMIASA